MDVATRLSFLAPLITRITVGYAFVLTGPTGDVSPLDVSPYVFFLLLTWLVLFGAGPVSLDTLLARWVGVEPQPEGGKK